MIKPLAPNTASRTITGIGMHPIPGKIRMRPLHASAAKHNLGSLRVLEKCGFKLIGCAYLFPDQRKYYDLEDLWNDAKVLLRVQ